MNKQKIFFYYTVFNITEFLAIETCINCAFFLLKVREKTKIPKHYYIFDSESESISRILFEIKIINPFTRNNGIFKQ